MKEYKVIKPKLGFKNRHQNLEDILNQYAREGWIFKQIDDHMYTIVFERDKNR